MIVVLTVIALISGLALGGLNNLTYETAQNNILKFKKIPAVANIYKCVQGEGDLDEAALVKLEEELLAEKQIIDLGEEEPLLMFVVKKDNKPHAVAIENFGPGYGGDLGVMVGFNIETDEVVGIGITTLSETPGLGTRVMEDAFTKQFINAPGDTIFKLKKDGGPFDAISGATVSSRAVTQAIEKADAFYDKHKEKILEAVKP